MKESKYFLKKIKFLNHLFLGLILIIFSFIFEFFIIYSYNDEIRNVSKFIDTDSYDKYVYVDVKEYSDKYATYKNGDSTQSFYVVKDDKYLYIAAIKGSIYKKLPTKIYGYTKTIPNELKKLTLDLYASSDYNEVTDQTFYNYFGYYYIDTYKSPIDDVIGFSIIISIVFIIGLGFIISYISKNKHNKKVFNEYDIENLKLEIDSNDTIINHMGKSYLTKEKLICYSSKLLIIDLKNIIWIYPHTLRSNGRDYNSLVAVNKKGKTMTVTSYSTANRRAKESFDEFYQSIINRNKDILYGYTTENMDKVDEIINNRKV